jgi:hypothetical protein
MSQIHELAQQLTEIGATEQQKQLSQLGAALQAAATSFEIPKIRSVMLQIIEACQHIDLLE